ncbi:uncharacterized protein LOC129399964 isoform X1 [Sorex araneus]|uniref:uncharacterized protein LOC129399964 isoform X1 n=1 Tax=Sorex araneus TaxID=42254 RepID=UPI00243408FA|nr:uncharacterized protein LOC129399964 isoform X1 [Sorex araneus]XP_054977777.1 uncharacterized protein LOC129399964 isoform X1 [Sorex araneus]XP_054977778.1 uncharacterized protein LOC129399964 isoform X1 [Sorex araneus]
MGNYLSRQLGSYLNRYTDSTKSALLPVRQQHRSTQTRAAFGPLEEAQCLALPRRLRFRVQTPPPLEDPPDLVHSREEAMQGLELWRPILEPPVPCTFLGLDGAGEQLQGVLKPILLRPPQCPYSQSLADITPPFPDSSGEGDSHCTGHLSIHSEEAPPRTPSGYRKGKRRLDGPEGFGSPEAKKRRLNPEFSPSAFRPVWKDGMVRMFVPQPGPLRTTLFPYNNMI